MVVHKISVEYFPASPGLISRLFFKGSGGSGSFCVTTHRLAFIKRRLWSALYPQTVQDLDRLLESHGGWSSAKSNMISLRVNQRGAKAPTTTEALVATAQVAAALTGLGELSSFTSETSHDSELTIKTREPDEVVRFGFGHTGTADSVRRTMEDGPYKGPQFPS